jgi:hypothetical protein
MYSKEEKISIVHWYNCNYSLRQIRDLFSVTYPNRPIPSIGTIHSVMKTFYTEGCVLMPTKRV